MFIVLVTHNTGHGESSDVMLLTEAVKRAVAVAREAEHYEYEFYGTEVGIGVYQLAPEDIYHKGDFKWHSGDPAPSTAVFYRRHTRRHDGSPHPHGGECWTEEWFDARLQEMVDGTA